MINLDEIIKSMNLPKRISSLEELELLSDEIDDKIMEMMIEHGKCRDEKNMRTESNNETN